MSKEFERLEREDVVSVYSNLILVKNRTFMVGEFITVTREAALSYLKSLTRDQDKWFADGIDCQVLKPGAKGWQKGKVRLTLEFCPDETEAEKALTNNQLEISQPESPLDDIRRTMLKDS